MRKELLTGRAILNRLFRDFFTQIVDETKEPRQFLSFQKQTNDLQIDSPRILVFQGENGLGKSSAISQCINIAQDIGEGLKKPVVPVVIDTEEYYFENGIIPSSPRQLLDVINSSIVKSSPSIRHYFTKYQDTVAKLERVTTLITTLIREEWMYEPKNGDAESDFQSENDAQLSTWLQRHIPKQDLDLYNNSEKHLAEIIATGLIEISTENFLMFCFDSYEYLSPELSQWFRQEFISKFLEQSKHTMVIISGCGSIGRDYRNEFSGSNVIVFNFNDCTFTYEDIRQISSKMECNLSESEVKKIENYSAGMPLAVIDILKHIKNGFSTSDVILDIKNEIWQLQEVTDSIFQRFLKYCTDSEKKERIFHLAMLDLYDSSVLSALWSVDESNVSAIIAELASEFMLFSSEKHLHSLIRSHLRTFLLNESHKKDSNLQPFFENYLQKCKTYLNTQLTKLYSDIPSEKNRYTSDSYINAVTNLVGCSLWSTCGTDDALKTISSVYDELLYFNTDLLSQLLAQLDECHDYLSAEQVSTIELLSSGVSYSSDEMIRNRVPVDEQEIEIVEYLEKFIDIMTPFQQAILSKKKGELEFRMGHLQEASVQFKKSFDLLKNAAFETTLLYDNFVQLGFAFQAINDFENAVFMFSIATSIRSDRFQPHYAIGLSRIKLNQISEANKALIESVKINPDHQDALFQLGKTYGILNDFESSIDSLSKAIEKGPYNQDIWFEIGKAYVKLEKYDDAVNALSKVLEKAPKHFDALILSGQAYRALQKIDDAVDAYKKALDIKPDSFETYEFIAKTLNSKKEYQDAIIYFEKAIAIKNDDSSLLLDLAKTAFDSCNYAKAIEAAQKCVALDKVNFDGWMILANAFTASEKHADAIEALLTASELNTENATIQNQIGKSYYALGKYTEAITAFTSAASKDPSLKGPWFDIGLCYYALQNYQDAADSFKKAAEYEPDRTDCWLQSGDTYMITGQTEEAMKCYTKATELLPQSGDVWHRKGVACLHANNYDEAILALVKAAELCNNVYDIWYSMAIAYYAAGHIAESIQAFQQAADIDSTRPDVWFHLGAAKQDLQQFEESIEAYNKSLEFAPDQSEALYRLGCSYYMLQKYNEAIEALKKAFAFEPENITIVQQLGLACHAAGDFDSAIEYYHSVTAKHPDSTETWFNLALALHSKGDLENAIGIYNNILDIWPDNADVYHNLGLAYYSVGHPYDAIKAYRQAVKICPDFSEIWFHLGVAFYSVEQYGEAIQAYRKVVQLTQDNFDAWYNLGLSYYIWGQYDDAIEAYEKVIELKPDHSEAMGCLCATHCAASEFEKAIEYGLKSIEIQDHEWIRTYLVIAYASTNSIENANIQADTLIAMDSSMNEIVKAIDMLHAVQAKNKDIDGLKELIDKLSSASTQTLPISNV